MDVVCFTVFTVDTIAQARIMSASLRKHHPLWRLVGVVADVSGHASLRVDPAEPFDRIIYAETLVPDYSTWAGQYNSTELYTAVQSLILLHLAEAAEAEAIIYLAVDTVLFAPLSAVEKRLRQYEIVLTPQVTKAEEDSLRAPPAGALPPYVGIYDPGLIAVRASGEGVRFVRWWSRRLLAAAMGVRGSARSPAQTWCDQVPALFDNVHVLRHEGYNVSPSNIATRKVTLDSLGNLCANSSHLATWRFSGFYGDARLTSSLNNSDDHLIREILLWYKTVMVTRKPS